MLFQNGRIRDKGRIFDIIYIQVVQITYGKAAIRFIPTIRCDCNMCSGEKIRTAPVRKKPEMRNVGYYTWQHFNLQITQT